MKNELLNNEVNAIDDNNFGKDILADFTFKHDSEELSLETVLEKLENYYNEFKDEFPNMLKARILSDVDLWNNSTTFNGTCYPISQVISNHKSANKKRVRSFSTSPDLSMLIYTELLALHSKLEAMSIWFKLNDVKDEILLQRLAKLKTDCKSFIKPILGTLEVIPNHIAEIIAKV